MTETPFGDLDDFIALPRVSGLAVSPDGLRVVTTVSELNEKRTEYVAAVWEVDPEGHRPARRLTRGAKGESSPAFTSDGDVLFVAVRPTEDDDKPPAALWRLPAAGGEAGRGSRASRRGRSRQDRRDAARAVVRAPLLPSAAASTTTVGYGACARTTRSPRFCTPAIRSGTGTRTSDLAHLICSAWTWRSGPAPVDLTPQPGGALREAGFDVSADGRFVVTSWQRPAPDASQHSVLVRIDLSSGDHTVIADEPDADLWGPTSSPDGSAVAFIREAYSTPMRAPRITLGYLRFGEDPIEIAAGWDRWPVSVTWACDGDALIVTADDGGRCPVFRIGIRDGGVEALTTDDYAYTDVRAAPGGVVYALRSSYAAPPHPVRIDPDGAVTVLPCVEPPALPGSLTEIMATAADGTAVRSWLVLPEDSHGRGPLRSFSGFTVGRWPAGTPGTGGGTRGCWRRGAMRCCCRTRRCRPATARTSSSGAGAHGAARRTTI